MHMRYTKFGVGHCFQHDGWFPLLAFVLASPGNRTVLSWLVLAVNTAKTNRKGVSGINIQNLLYVVFIWHGMYLAESSLTTSLQKTFIDTSTGSSDICKYSARASATRPYASIRRAATSPCAGSMAFLAVASSVLVNILSLTTASYTSLYTHTETPLEHGIDVPKKWCLEFTHQLAHCLLKVTVDKPPSPG